MAMAVCRGSLLFLSSPTASCNHRARESLFGVLRSVVVLDISPSGTGDAIVDPGSWSPRQHPTEWSAFRGVLPILTDRTLFEKAGMGSKRDWMEDAILTAKKKSRCENQAWRRMSEKAKQRFCG